MSKKYAKGGNYGRGTFVETSVFLSPAFLSLGTPGTAPQVATCSCQMLMLLLGKRAFGRRKDHKGVNTFERTDDNKFNLTYAELKARGISNTRATRGFSELLAKGFIEIAHQGGAYDKDKSQYSLTETDDYLRWRIGHKPIRERSPDIVNRGFQKKKKKPTIVRIKSTMVRRKTQQLQSPAMITHTITGDSHP
jgi:hypothetical protein